MQTYTLAINFYCSGHFQHVEKQDNFGIVNSWCYLKLVSPRFVDWSIAKSVFIHIDVCLKKPKTAVLFAHILNTLCAI